MYEGINYKPITYTGSLTVGPKAPTEVFLMYVRGNRELIKITPTGDIYWNGRLVETDEDFKASMLEMAECFKGRL
jgi:hypothetical protein